MEGVRLVKVWWGKCNILLIIFLKKKINEIYLLPFFKINKKN